MPFTSLRFARPRLPTLNQAVGLGIGLLALGLGVWTLSITGRTDVMLTQTRTLLAVNTRGAAAGRLAADRLAASAQADATQMMAAQDLARRQAARAAGIGGYMPPAYGSSSQPGETGAAVSASLPSVGGAAYGSPYSQSPYGGSAYAGSSYGHSAYGGAQQAGAAPVSDGNAMGYTLPQATTH